jgi:pantoate--beta-alanine ligase
MEVLKSIDTIRLFIQKKRLSVKKIGLVPTMGALHDGHLELVKFSKGQNDLTIVSIFVNPTQFNKKEDFEKYPNKVSEDLKTLEEIGCDVIFTPDSKEMYTENETLKFNFGYVERLMEGEFRPGHFSGVGLVISKLFNIVNPDRAYFGEKDLQQLTIIKKLAKDLNFNVEIIGVPTVREASGLAMSSRNLRLSELEKEIAINVYKSLRLFQDLLGANNSIVHSKNQVIDFLKSIKGLELEYLEIVDTYSLMPIMEII